MDDKELRALGRKERRLAARISSLKAEQQAIRDELTEEMDRRGSLSVISGAVTVTLVAPESVVYDEAKARRLLTRRDPQLWEDCCVQVFSRDRMAALVQEGRIRMSTVDKVTSVVPGTKYVRVTLGQES